MPYVKAEDVLPSELLKEIQKYVQGSLVYIPRPGEGRVGWGSRSGARELFDKRNAAIRAAKAGGMSVEALSEEYGISEDGIRKVLYGEHRQRAS